MSGPNSGSERYCDQPRPGYPPRQPEDAYYCSQAGPPGWFPYAQVCSAPPPAQPFPDVPQCGGLAEAPRQAMPQDFGYAQAQERYQYPQAIPPPPPPPPPPYPQYQSDPPGQPHPTQQYQYTAQRVYQQPRTAPGDPYTPRPHESPSDPYPPTNSAKQPLQARVPRSGRRGRYLCKPCRDRKRGEPVIIPHPAPPAAALFYIAINYAPR